MGLKKTYIEHPIFEQLSKYAEFYESLAYSVMLFISTGTQSIFNIDSYVYSSMRGTLESIKDILIKGRINDAYALLRKYYDAAIINIYTCLYLEDNLDIENFIVEKVNNWVKGDERLPNIRTMNNYIQRSKKTAKIYKLLHKDGRYSDLRDRCNDNMHYNFYFNVVLNDNQIRLNNRLSILNMFSKDLENILILHLSYLFYINEHYMMASDYIDCLECGVEPEPDSQYLVAPFIQEIFDTVINKNRKDLAIEVKNKTNMTLE